MKKAYYTACIPAIFLGAAAAGAAGAKDEFGGKIDYQPRPVASSTFSSAAVHTRINIYMGYNLSLSAEHSACTRDGYLVTKKTAFEIPLDIVTAAKIDYTMLGRITDIYRTTVGPQEDRDLAAISDLVPGTDLETALERTGAMPLPGEQPENGGDAPAFNESMSANIGMWRAVESALGFGYGKSGGKWVASEYKVLSAPAVCKPRT